MTAYRTDFDPLFASAAATYLSDWQGKPALWLKAEAIAESNLDPSVTARDGGMGIAQFMPATWDQICEELKFPKTMLGLRNDPAYPMTMISSAYEPTVAIHGMAYYLSTLWDQWSSPRPWFDRLQLTQASYNTGFGNILKAQRLAGGAVDYDSIIAKLPKVTGHDNATITQHYVSRIHDLYVQLTSTQ